MTERGGLARRFHLVFVVAVGSGCGLVAVAFHHAIVLARSALIGAVLTRPPGAARLALILLLPAAMGAVLAVILPRVAPEAGGGLALVRRAYTTDALRIGPRTLIGTFIANPLSLGAGTPLGPEGPTVVLTSGFAARAAHAAGLPLKFVKGMIPVGTAAGIAAIFNTPITGVVFAMEELIGTASRAVLGSALVAAVAAAVVERQLLGGRNLLPATAAGWRDPRELLGFALVGVVSGAVAGAVPRVVPVLRAGLRRLCGRLGGFAPAAQGAFAGVLVGMLGVLSTATLGVGYTPVSRWLSGGGDAGEAAAAFGAKAVGLCVSLAGGLVGGVFAPSLFIGASLGAAAGHTFRLLLPHLSVDPAAWALVGMGAFFAGFLRTPIASVLIVFELTGDYALVLPLMLAVALSSVVARALSAHTLVEQQLEEQGVEPPEESKDPLAGYSVADVMSTDVAALRAEETVDSALGRLAAAPHNLLPVLDGDGTCRRVVDWYVLERAQREGHGGHPVARAARPAPVLATPEETLDRLSVRLGAAGETRCPVVESPAHPRLVGLLSSSDLLRARHLSSRDDEG